VLLVTPAWMALTQTTKLVGETKATEKVRRISTPTLREMLLTLRTAQTVLMSACKTVAI
jgi:hypothetical protein